MKCLQMKNTEIAFGLLLLFRLPNQPCQGYLHSEK